MVKDVEKIEPEIEIVEEEDEDDDDDEEEELELEDHEPELLNMFQHYFTSDDGLNIVDVLSSIKKSIDTQNKIQMKLMQKLD